jgi:hypothetical protein
MFVQKLNSLVLGGASVLCDGQVVGARIGISYLAEMQPPVTPVTSLRPSETEPASDTEARSKRVDLPRMGNAPALWAGRSICFSGVLSSFPRIVRQGSLGAFHRTTWAKPAGRTPPAAWRGWGS